MTEIKATLLTKPQIWGDAEGNDQLEVMKDFGTAAGMSDLAILQGGLVLNTSRTPDCQRTGYYWSASSDGDGYVRHVHGGGDRYIFYPYKRLVGARPALPSSVTSAIEASGASLPRKTICDGKVEVVEYGEYPQKIADDEAAKALNALTAEELKAAETGKTYTLDVEKPPCAEVEYEGKRYIRVKAQPYGKDSILSTNRLPAKGEACWLEVQPIEWLADPSGWWVAKQALFSGIPFDDKERYDGIFENTKMHKHLNEHFVRDMQPSRNRTKEYADLVHELEARHFDPAPLLQGKHPLDLTTGAFGDELQEIAQLSPRLNNVVRDWGCSWAGQENQPAAAKTDLKKQIQEILDVYHAEMDNEDGQAIYKLSQKLTPAKMNAVVDRLYQTMVNNKPLILSQGLSAPFAAMISAQRTAPATARFV